MFYLKQIIREGTYGDITFQYILHSVKEKAMSLTKERVFLSKKISSAKILKKNNVLQEW